MYGDRFIPRRYVLDQNKFNKKCTLKKQAKDVLKSCITVSYWRQNNFIATVNNKFDIQERRILALSDPLENFEFILYKTIYDNTSGHDWPCKPRPKPLAFPDTTHDLPGFNSYFDHNLVDWSVNGQIVASFGHDVIIWKRNEDLTMVFNLKCPRSVAYSPNGKYLAIGCKACDYPVLELWDVNSLSEFLIVNGKVFQKKYAEVRSIAWNKFSNKVVCGTHFGTIFVLTVPDLKVSRSFRKHQLPVTIIKFSHTMRYLASGDIEGNIVIYNWDSCDVYLVVRSRRKLNVVFDWHPWNGVDLVISEDVPASIVILHVPSKEIVAYYQRKDTKITINSVTFSKITGELLVSIAKNDGGSTDFKILVMSSLDRIVDMLKIPQMGVRFMMWNPEGTKLATTGNDETLTIWNFCPGNKSHIVPINRKNVLDCEFGFQFKMWSCVR